MFDKALLFFMDSDNMIRSHPLHMGVTAPNLAQQVGYLTLSYLTVVMYFLEIHPSFFHKDRHAHGTPSPDKEYSIHWCHQPESESQQDCHSQDTICIISFFEFPTLLNLWATISSQTHTQVHKLWQRAKISVKVSWRWKLSASSWNSPF